MIGTTTPINPEDASAMARHWLGTPVGGYLGQDYGSDPYSLLHNPMGAGTADGFLAKLRADVPLFANAPADAVNLYAVETGMDSYRLMLDVAGHDIEVTG